MSALGICYELLTLTLYIVTHAVRELYYFITRSRPCAKLEKESVLITGSAQGMGAVYARQLAELGNTVHCVDIQCTLNESMVQGLREAGHKAYSYTADITDWTSLQQLKEEVEANDGPVTVLINNAGICMGRSLIDLTPTQIARTLNVNLLSQFLVTKTFLPSMLAARYGYIINMASTAGYLAGCQVSDYCASKYGSVGFSECLLEELQGTGVHCTFVCPFYTTSGMFEGLRVRFSSLFPALSTEYVVSSAIQGMRQKEACVMAPGVFWVLVACKGLIPRAVFDRVCEFLGRKDVMTEFRGRGTAEEIK